MNIEFDPVYITESLCNWDDVEIHPFIEVEPGMYEVCEDVDKADIWSVYLHNVEGGIICIADFNSYEDAMKFANVLQILVDKFQRTEFTDLTPFKL